MKAFSRTLSSENKQYEAEKNFFRAYFYCYCTLVMYETKKNHPEFELLGLVGSVCNLLLIISFSLLIFFLCDSPLLKQ